MGSGWGLAMLGPRLFIFFQGRTAWSCVKESFCAKLFSFIKSQSWLRVYFPARWFDFDFGSLHGISQSFNFSDSWHILNFRGLVLIFFISRLFKVFIYDAFSGLPSLTLRSVTFLIDFFLIGAGIFFCSPCWGIGGGVCPHVIEILVT